MGMGSIIQSTPMIQSLRIKYPHAEIVFLTIDKNHELLRLFPFVDQIVTINDNSVLQLSITSIKALKFLLANRIDIFIDLEIYSNYSKILTAFSFAGDTIGFYRSGHPFKGIYSATIYYDITKPVKDIYLNAASQLGCETLYEDLVNFSEITNFNETNNPDDYIVINPNASDLRIERRWPHVNYINLIIRFLDLYPHFKIILTGSTNEKKYVSRIFNGIPEKYRSSVTDTSGNLNLTDLINIIHYSRFIITNDSGPMHLAFAIKKKTIALFGPCSPDGYITQPNAAFIYRKIHCSPCVHDYSVSPCHGDNMCMKLISVNEIIDIVKIFMTTGQVKHSYSPAIHSLKRTG
jgi:ADP-heptose:LPS heptosyltransferase